MRIECVKEKLKNAVLLAEKMTGKNLTLPVLSNILFTAKGNTLKVCATNLNLGIEIIIPAKVLREGVIAIQGNLINNLLSNLRTENLVLESVEKTVSITTPISKTILKTYPHEDFPTLPKIPKEDSFSIEIAKFIDGLKSVWYSASLSDIKPEIASVYVYSETDEIVFAATDSFRLAEKRIKHKMKQKITPLLIPAKNIGELIRVFEGVPGNAEIICNKNQLSITYEGIYITTRLVDGVFPDYQQIIPKEYTTELIVLKQEFMSALKITNLFADKFNQITFRVEPNKKIFEITAQNTDIGENTIVIDAALSGESMSLGFNQKYILDCFPSITKDSISLRFGGVNRPLVIQSVGDKSFSYLVMPLNQ